MTCTTAPQPLSASRSTAARRHCESTSNSSSGSYACMKKGKRVDRRD